jgi:hypothetical protein
MVDVWERTLEETIEAVLLAGGPDAYPGRAGVVVEHLEDHEMFPAVIGSAGRKTKARRFVLILGWFWTLLSPCSPRCGAAKAAPTGAKSKSGF